LGNQQRSVPGNRDERSETIESSYSLISEVPPMKAREQVNRNTRRRFYEVHSKERFIKELQRLYNKGLSQHEIAKILNIPRGTLSRWMVEVGIHGQFTLTGNQTMMLDIKEFLIDQGLVVKGKAIYPKQGCVSFEISSVETIRQLGKFLYDIRTGELCLDRKAQVFHSLMI
jgi:DNA-binding transcriptional regulator YiaG